MPGTTKDKRSANMAAIRSKDTKPEIIVRKITHALGYRYRLHKPGLPGKPDLVFGPKQKVIFVHGCFWHQHNSADCPKTNRPKSNTDYWNAKLARNVERDRKNLQTLRKLGWKVLVIWECETEDTDSLKERIINFLE